MRAASEHLARRELPTRLLGWQVAPGTGSPDGRSAVVVLTGTARIPVLTPVLERLGGGVAVSTTSTARSDVEP